MRGAISRNSPTVSIGATSWPMLCPTSSMLRSAPHPSAIGSQLWLELLDNQEHL